jgi:hypothetical protein
MPDNTNPSPLSHQAATSLALLGIIDVLTQELVKSGAVDAPRLSLALAELADTVGADRASPADPTFEQRVIALVRKTVETTANAKAQP